MSVRPEHKGLQFWEPWQRFLWLDFAQREWSCLRTPTFRCMSQCSQGYSCGTGRTEDLVILVKRGLLYQLTVATIMLYNNHRISVHIIVSIYFVYVFGAQLRASCLQVGFGQGGLALLHMPFTLFQDQQANQGMFISWKQKKHKTNSPNVTAHFKPLLTLNLLKYYWPKQIIWPSPESRDGVIHSTHRRNLQSYLAKNVDI